MFRKRTGKVMGKNSVSRTGAARKFLGCRNGASAVEFAIVAPIFLALVMSTFEVGWFYFVNATTDAATVNIARYIRTGQAQNDGYTSQGNRDDFFANKVCPKLQFLANCQSKITAEVKKFATFAELAADTSDMICRNDNPRDINNITFEPGSDNAIVRVRICMIYKTLNPAIGMSLAKNQSGERRITTTYILRVEPYSKKARKPAVRP